MSELGLGAILGLVALAVVLGALAAAAWLGWFARAEGARADEAERGKEAAEASADYEREKALIGKEGEDRANEVDRRGPDRDRVRRLLRGGSPPRPT